VEDELFEFLTQASVSCPFLSNWSFAVALLYFPSSLFFTHPFPASYLTPQEYKQSSTTYTYVTGFVFCRETNVDNDWLMVDDSDIDIVGVFFV